MAGVTSIPDPNEGKRKAEGTIHPLPQKEEVQSRILPISTGVVTDVAAFLRMHSMPFGTRPH